MLSIVAPIIQILGAVVFLWILLSIRSQIQDNMVSFENQKESCDEKFEKLQEAINEIYQYLDVIHETPPVATKRKLVRRFPIQFGRSD